MFFKKIFNQILNLIFPPKCVLCGKIIENNDSLCCECWHKIKFINKPFCDKCSMPFDFKISEDDICMVCLKNNPPYLKSRSAVVYDKNAAKIIFKFKFYDKLYMKKFMANCMLNAAADIIDDIDILIPTPLHKKRLIHRKYNQSLLLAKEIAKKSNKKVICDFLCKTKNTIPQVKLKQSERRKNLKNKFTLKEKFLKNIEKYKNLNFAIIDDVITTGSTVSECVKVLNSFGVKNVYVISFAKTVIK